MLFFKEKFMFFLNSLLATKWRVCVSTLHSPHIPHSPNRLKKKRKKRVVAASDIDTCNAGGISRSRSKLQRGMLHVARCKLQAHLIIIALCICPLWFNELWPHSSCCSCCCQCCTLQVATLSRWSWKCDCNFACDAASATRCRPRCHTLECSSSSRQRGEEEGGGLGWYVPQTVGGASFSLAKLNYGQKDLYRRF